ncbi:hypothetical protein K501DRAFT_333567 [Backusella circina FSU 941]|nr:hypothetical protein K501DRAFT_333567 [Backusella circina FSU 941]
MNQRKISCLECRRKKTKCDGQSPCERCISKGITQCMYSKLKAPGRPFKNATITKLSLSGNTEKVSFCKEFILENVEPKTMKSKRDDQSLTGILNKSFSTVFKHYQASLALNHKLKQQIASIPDRVYLTGLTHLFMGTICFISGIMIRRLSNLRLNYYTETSFLIYAINKDRSYHFFETPAPNAVVSNPLISLPPDEAIKLIDCFFELDPCSIVLNKTVILKKYWSDTADPLIMSVIYGSALAKLPLKENQPLELWSAWDKKNSNPFLQYAYTLLLNTNTQVTPNVYIATCLLAVFEGCFGFLKRALALFSVIITMGARLGLSNKAYLAGLDPLERESLIMAFWITFKSSVTGCLELERSAAYLYGKIDVPLPPNSCEYSASYQFDRLNNNVTSPQERGYLIESFYIECFISKLNQKMLICARKKPKNDDQKGRDIAMILDEFHQDINQVRSTWTELQRFTIDGIMLYYGICLASIKEDCYNFMLQQSELPPKFDLSQLDAVYLVNKLLPLSTQLIDKIMDFFSTPQTCFGDYSYAPMPLIISQLDSASQIIMYSAILDQQNTILRDYLQLVVMILSNPQYWKTWDAVDKVREPISKFLREFYLSPSQQQQQETPSPDLFDYNWIPDDLLFDVPFTPLYSLTDNIEVDALFDGII